MTQLPANISIANAHLPATYEHAKTALSNCASIDECQDWANKAEALAAYAKMADDDSLRKMADRIQARAVRRAQELLKQYPTGKGRPEKSKGDLGFNRKQAALNAGMSEHQYNTTQAIGKLPDDQFENAVESDKPPTISQLATLARNSPPPPEGFKQATHLLGTVKRFAAFCREHDAEHVAGGVMGSEVHEVKEHVATIDKWLDRFVINLGD